MSKRAIVLGGSGALGRVVVKTLRDRGVHVFASYLTREDVLRREEGLEPFRLDLCDALAVERTVRGFGDVDALVHCGALASTRTPPRWESLEEVDLDGFDRLIAVNVKSALIAARAAKIEGGNIVFVGSIGGGKSIPAPAPYAASKAALSGLASALAKELGPRRTLVNVVAPGLLESGVSSLVPERLRREYVKHNARKRLGELSEVANLIAFLALENTYVTGRTIAVDGGM